MRKLLPITYYLQLLLLTSPILVLAQAQFLLESCLSEVIKGDKSVAYTHGLFTRPLFLQKVPGESHREGVERGKSFSVEDNGALVQPVFRKMTADY